MKSISTFFLLLSIFTFQQYTYAQNAEGCDGVRYYYDVFDEDQITETDVLYGVNSTAAPNDEVQLEMTVFQPESDDVEKRPLMIWAHGGAFVTGERSDMNELCMRFAQKGFVTATMSYRLFPYQLLGLPDSVDMLDAAVKAIGDMKAVVRYFRQDAATVNNYKIDPDRIFVAGLSAGAIMAIHIGYLDSSDNLPAYFTEILNNNGGLEGDTGDADNLSYPSNVQGIINLAGGIHKLDWIGADDIPIISYHGDADDVVPYNFGFTNVLGFNFMTLNGSGSIHNYIETENLNIPNFIVTAPGGDHESAFGDDYAEYLESFIEDGQVFLYDLVCADIPIDVDELQVDEKVINAFPNPSSDLITLDLSRLTTDYDLRVYDFSGREVYSAFAQNGGSYELRKTELGEGIFMVVIRAEGELWRKKVLFY